ncbi:membrane protein [Candidatus Magnetoovum chiemensis]|nr:membrane protein [Candidatus Magnetoovum chiemensis]
MSAGSRVFIIILGMAILIFTFELVRKHKFREELSLLWFFFGFLVIAGSFADRLLDPFARYLLIGYPPVIIIVFLLVLLVAALLYFSMIISDLKVKIKELTQKVAFLEHEIDKNNEDSL